MRSVKPKANEIPFSFNKMRKALDLLVQIALFPLPRIHSETVRRCSRHLPELADEVLFVQIAAALGDRRDALVGGEQEFLRGLQREAMTSERKVVEK